MPVPTKAVTKYPPCPSVRTLGAPLQLWSFRLLPTNVKLVRPWSMSALDSSCGQQLEPVIESPSAVIFQEPAWAGNEGALVEPLGPAGEAFAPGCTLGSKAALP